MGGEKINKPNQTKVANFVLPFTLFAFSVNKITASMAMCDYVNG